MINWAKHEQTSKAYGQHKSTDGKLVNMHATNLSYAFWAFKMKCFDWLPANQTVIMQKIQNKHQLKSKFGKNAVRVLET